MRDDFTEKTKIILAQRVGYNCSNPDCRRPTSGSHTDPNKSTLIGVAAHITAASPGGPRYDNSLTPSKRKEIENGIWLCESCARLIDKDEAKFSIKYLNTWKSDCERSAFEALQKNVNAKTPMSQNIPFLELDLTWASKVKRPIVNKGVKGLSLKNKQVFGDSPIPVGEGIYYNELRWTYDLVIYNNSSFPAYNIKIVEDSLYAKFNYIDKLSTVNNIPALENVKIVAKFIKEFEGTGEQAENEIKVDVPKEIIGKKIIIEYQDALRNVHVTESIINLNGIMNSKIK
jgi:hypothetical protein